LATLFLFLSCDTAPSSKYNISLYRYLVSWYSESQASKKHKICLLHVSCSPW
jgi:hypothetical protein